ncbi:hypothetical protein M408DRAFT_29580 [Serendipita vermifera MAFF 305830]|uniref:Uncharacterized protein n=1 Tax=Serendipita vermifera MAFF 305830 TaxID=933852 RepID=A0A0C2WVM7_SERVB|nr:hypothetical protein M408DRAFT_29580 [Serendipita vermifera MAFF 305830]
MNDNGILGWQPTPTEVNFLAGRLNDHHKLTPDIKEMTLCFRLISEFGTRFAATNRELPMTYISEMVKQFKEAAVPDNTGVASRFVLGPNHINQFGGTAGNQSQLDFGYTYDYGNNQAQPSFTTSASYTPDSFGTQSLGLDAQQDNYLGYLAADDMAFAKSPTQGVGINMQFPLATTSGIGSQSTKLGTSSLDLSIQGAGAGQIGINQSIGTKGAPSTTQDQRTGGGKSRPNPQAQAVETSASRPDSQDQDVLTRQSTPDEDSFADGESEADLELGLMPVITMPPAKANHKKKPRRNTFYGSKITPELAFARSLEGADKNEVDETIRANPALQPERIRVLAAVRRKRYMELSESEKSHWTAEAEKMNESPPDLGSVRDCLMRVQKEFRSLQEEAYEAFSFPMATLVFTPPNKMDAAQAHM